MPVLLFKTDFDSPPPWQPALRELMPELEVRLWPDVGDRSEVDYALVFKPVPGLFDELSNLKVIFSLGAGIDHLLSDVPLPRGVPVVRMVDGALTEGMSEYALYMTLRFHRQMGRYERQQAEGLWRPLLPQPRACDCRVGVMGLGQIGADVARKIAAVGYEVAGWSRTAKQIEGVTGFAGQDALAGFLARSDVLICVLPLTEATNGIINRDTLRQLPRGAFVINIGRGAHLVEADLLTQLEEGHIAGAALDVFAEEPLPRDHPLWRHPDVVVTPHIASVTNPYTAAEHVVANIRRHLDGEPLTDLADVERGY